MMPGRQGSIVLRPTLPFTFMLGYQNDPEEPEKPGAICGSHRRFRHARRRRQPVLHRPELGEDDIKAWIIPEGAAPAEIDLIRWCLASLAPFKLPRYIAFVEDFPRSATKREVERAKVKAWPDTGDYFAACREAGKNEASTIFFQSTGASS